MAHFRFRFDARGLPIPYAPPVAKGLVAPAITRPSRKEPDSREDAALLNQLKEWLEEHPDFGLDMEILEQREVLVAPPHWSYVSPAAASLSSGEVTDSVSEADQRQAVSKYLRMLVNREVELDAALGIAAMVSNASRSPDPAQRMRDALKALPRNAKMDPRSGLPPVPEVPRLLAERKVVEWAEAVRERHEHIVSSTIERDFQAVERVAWKEWKTRFLQYRKGRRRFEVTAEDLLLRTRSAGPSALFRNDLGQMPVREWTEALLSAVRGDLPSSVEPIPTWVRGEIERELLTGRKTLLLIQGESAFSPTAQWLPSKKNGCLWIERGRWSEYLDALRLADDAPFAEAQLIAAVEVSGDSEAIVQAVRRDPLELAPLSTTVFVGSVQYVYLGRDKLPPQATPLVPYVDNAKDVDDAISKIQALGRVPLRGGHAGGVGRPLGAVE